MAGTQVGTTNFMLLRWSGRRWTRVGSLPAPATAMWAFSERDVWMGASDFETGFPIAIHWDGATAKVTNLQESRMSVSSTWAREEVPSVTEPPPEQGHAADQQVGGLWGTGAGHPVLAVFRDSTESFRLWERFASGWLATHEAPGLYPSTAAGTPDGKLAVAVGSDNHKGIGVVYSWDGTKLTRLVETDEDLGGVFLLRAGEVSPADIWIVGFSSNIGPFTYRNSGPGGAWEVKQEGPVTVPWNAVAPVSDREVWMAGNDGTLVRYDGGSDVVAGSLPGTTLLQSWHRTSVTVAPK